MNEMSGDGEAETKSSMPEKKEGKFIKAMKGQFNMGENVDIVKDGSNYNIFKKNVSGGAHPVKMNDKQFLEFFGQKMSEAFGQRTEPAMAQEGLKDVYQGVKAVAGKAVGGAVARIKAAVADAQQVYKDAKAKSAVDSAVNKIISIVKDLKQYGNFGKVKDEKIKSSIQTAIDILMGGKSFSLAAMAPKATPTASTSKERPATGASLGTMPSPPPLNKASSNVVSEEGFKPKPAKFVDKNATKPKKAKEIGAFRKGKSGSGTKSPKD